MCVCEREKRSKHSGIEFVFPNNHGKSSSFFLFFSSFLLPSSLLKDQRKKKKERERERRERDVTVLLPFSLLFLFVPDEVDAGGYPLPP